MIINNLGIYDHFRQSMLGLTYNLEISICCIAVHDCLSRAGVATFMPNLDVHYSQVTAAITILRIRKQTMT